MRLTKLERRVLNKAFVIVPNGKPVMLATEVTKLLRAEHRRTVRMVKAMMLDRMKLFQGAKDTRAMDFHSGQVDALEDILQKLSARGT